ncbi:MAG: WecB/TagA/CpsF family glycosyltransferase, partial [Patescibacteria group bacterium]
MNKINIAGINISTLPKEEIFKKIRFFLSSGQNQITTPNPEFVVMALKDEEFFYILNNSSLAIADGFGLALASIILGGRVDVIHGSDLIYDICRIAEEEKKSVYLLGGEDGVAKSAAANLKKIFPDLII